MLNKSVRSTPLSFPGVRGGPGEEPSSSDTTGSERFPSQRDRWSSSSINTSSQAGCTKTWGPFSGETTVRRQSNTYFLRCVGLLSLSVLGNREEPVLQGPAPGKGDTVQSRFMPQERVLREPDRPHSRGLRELPRPGGLGSKQWKRFHPGPGNRPRHSVLPQVPPQSK